MCDGGPARGDAGGGRRPGRRGGFGGGPRLRADGSAPALAEPAVFHLFLPDGTAIATLGEFARVGDRVVFTLPISRDARHPRQPAAARVDWERTNRYTDVRARLQQYAATRGEADFAAMSAMVARTLERHRDYAGRGAQLELAERARRTLAEWPRQHYNYRADEVRQTLSLLDEVVAGLRAAAGRTSFDVSFVADTLPPPVEPVLPRPTLQESIEQALRLSDLAGSAAERTMLLRAVGAVAARARRTRSRPPGYRPRARGP